MKVDVNDELAIKLYGDLNTFCNDSEYILNIIKYRMFIDES